ncbi:DUF4252 domain-containing protein [Flavobacteriaceae bacterium F89]|jgi:hypothetical protein|uniref:DUF4252 domain-containing protein n=1 Tax=Cerina litoralis TaxID=2874477 RepID=A0AAE3JSR7_9FLAO|nr:DUF4252 domain-containing protein [Cerina litoralis]MCG2460802.1 DUF4252 domain-containing protein [Cerina litoralis]
MKTVKYYFAFIGLIILSACSSTQSLQEYYVDNSDNPNFISLDLPASLLNLDEVELTPEQRKAVQSLRKLNVLAFKKTADNGVDFEAEKAKVNAILKDDKYVQLMKLNSGFGKGVVKYLGDEDAIDEVVVYGSNDEKGFALIRILGDNMNPAYLTQLVQALQKSSYKGEGMEHLGDLLNN